MNIEKSWTVVKFLTDNSVAAVPSKWIIDNNKCLWPPFTSEKLTAAIKSLAIDTCWPTYDVDVFRNATYETYETARAKARKAEDTSDLNTTDSENPSGRRKFKKKIFSSSESSEDESNKVIKKFPVPPKLSVLPTHVVKSNARIESVGCSSSQQNLAAKETSCSSSSSENSMSFLQENIPLLTQPPRELTKVKNIKNPVTEIAVNNIPCTCCPRHVDHHKEILRQLFYLRSLTREMLDDIKTIKDGSKLNDGNLEQNKDSIYKLFQLPLKTAEELTKFNEHLNDQNNYLSVELELAKVGGNNNYEFIRRCLGSLLTNELALKYSWLGRREKERFCGLAIANLIITSAERAKKSTERKETEESMQNWLKRAGERLKKERK